MKKAAMTANAPKPVGRPSSYTVELGEQICELIAEGESLRDICRRDDMPARSVVFRWLSQDQQFADLYTRSREEQAELLAGEIIAISDESANDTYIDEQGNTRTNAEVVARSKLRVEARKWVAAKLKPRVYGDKLQTEVTGKDGAPLFDPSQLSDEALAILSSAFKPQQ